MTKLRKIEANNRDNKVRSILNYVNSKSDTGESDKSNDIFANYQEDGEPRAGTSKTSYYHYEKEPFTDIITGSLNQSQVVEEMPTLGGKCNVEDVKQLLKEWVLESKNPDNEDMEIILEFLLKLINATSLVLR